MARNMVRLRTSILGSWRYPIDRFDTPPGTQLSDIFFHGNQQEPTDRRGRGKVSQNPKGKSRSNMRHAHP